VLDLVELLRIGLFHLKRGYLRRDRIPEAAKINARAIPQLGHDLPAQVIANASQDKPDRSRKRRLVDTLPNRDAIKPTFEGLHPVLDGLSSFPPSDHSGEFPGEPTSGVAGVDGTAAVGLRASPRTGGAARANW
jgi:hypothetical protein